MPAPLDTNGGKSSVQAVGSTDSFLRRYVACNIFNIVVVGDDDDGTGGTLDEAQTKTVLDLMKRAKVGPKFLKYMRAQSVEQAGSLETAAVTAHPPSRAEAITSAMPTDPVAGERVGRHGRPCNAGRSILPPENPPSAYAQRIAWNGRVLSSPALAEPGCD